METLLVFLAIAAIQIVASYSKQKKKAAKEAAEKAARKSAPPPEATEPIPDPFREIREAMGLPEREEPEYYEEYEEPVMEEEPEPEPEPPRQPIVHREPIEEKRKLKFNTSQPLHGILWNAILQEPRYKVKWKR